MTQNTLRVGLTVENEPLKQRLPWAPAGGKGALAPLEYEKDDAICCAPAKWAFGTRNIIIPLNLV